MNQSRILHEVFTSSEAEEVWELPPGSLKRDLNRGRFDSYEARKSGGTWLLSRMGLERIYGEIKEEEMMYRNSDILLPHDDGNDLIGKWQLDPFRLIMYQITNFELAKILPPQIEDTANEYFWCKLNIIQDFNFFHQRQKRDNLEATIIEATFYVPNTKDNFSEHKKSRVELLQDCYNFFNQLNMNPKLAEKSYGLSLVRQSHTEKNEPTLAYTFSNNSKVLKPVRLLENVKIPADDYHMRMIERILQKK